MKRDRRRKRNRNPFRAQVIDYIWRRDEIQAVGGHTADIILESIDRVMERYRNDEEGVVTIKAIEMVYIRKTHSVQGAADECGFDRATIYRGVNEFVKDVCLEAGLMK